MKSVKITGLRVFAGIVIGLIVAAIGGGLYLSGSPGKERDRQFDARRLSDLQQIASAVDSYYSRNNSLPPDLDVLTSTDGREGYLIGNFRDPRSDRGYEYEPLGEADFQLCAVFDLPSETLDQQGLKQPPPVREPMPVATVPMITEKGVMGRIRTWEHDGGHYCFQLNATDAIGSVLCGLRNPCPAGQTCAALPRNKGTLCVAQGTECAAAGCPGQCTLAESYPVQVTCPATGTDMADDGCRLMQNEKTGDVDCFGCANGTCSLPPVGWTEYSAAREPGRVGIPYACFEGPNGCELAQ